MKATITQIESVVTSSGSTKSIEGKRKLRKRQKVIEPAKEPQASISLF
jgi:hypothetical protein